MLTVAEFVWAVKPDSPIKTIKDLKGRKIGYTNPRSTSQALAILLLQAAGYKAEDVELVKTGGFGEGVAALDIGAIDVAPMAEPLWSKFKDKYRAIAIATDILPPLDNVVGVTTRTAAETRGDFIRAVIRARRKAVEFMDEQSGRSGRHHRQALQPRPGGGAQRRAQPRSPAAPRASRTGARASSTWTA